MLKKADIQEDSGCLYSSHWMEFRCDGPADLAVATADQGAKMNELRRLEDLPEDYRAALSERISCRYGPALRSPLPPGKPAIRT